jgi:hypothetical protein
LRRRQSFEGALMSISRNLVHISIVDGSRGGRQHQIA